MSSEPNSLVRMHHRAVRAQQYACLISELLRPKIMLPGYGVMVIRLQVINVSNRYYGSVRNVAIVAAGLTFVHMGLCTNTGLTVFEIEHQTPMIFFFPYSYDTYTTWRFYFVMLAVTPPPSPQPSHDHVTVNATRISCNLQRCT